MGVTVRQKVKGRARPYLRAFNLIAAECLALVLTGRGYS